MTKRGKEKRKTDILIKFTHTAGLHYNGKTLCGLYISLFDIHLFFYTFYDAMSYRVSVYDGSSRISVDSFHHQ